MAILGVVAIVSLGLTLVQGHGRLADPIGRSSLWRSLLFSILLSLSKDQVETEDCFERYPLQLADGSGTRYQLGNGSTGKYDVKLKLPDGVKCDLCSIRWHYRTGNSWGVCPDGTGKMGCGDQETFRNCADISIA
ncbi:hypothetical protein J437_LFUL009351 [Ladona fulva]|uniref:Chitin-binding type-4 domain-containing protein n=1 Tax=Ladona fulva TaxID=123851 RepID=A0A8K0P031_LADFU|nr:hypothetical protein J437_LFUL009351 [Ladona fulva]